MRRSDRGSLFSTTRATDLLAAAAQERVKILRSVRKKSRPSVSWNRFCSAVGAALFLTRHSLELRQATVIQTLAEDHGIEVSQGWLSRVESGKKSLDLEKFGFLCQIYGVTPKRIFEVAARFAEFRGIEQRDAQKALRFAVRKAEFGRSTAIR